MTANMLNEKLKTNESGRSMVEMLGVLAVIGVLSIAGIAGYTTAMNNYHANETVNQARLLASIVSTQRLLNANGGDLSDDDLKGKFTFDPSTTDSIKLTATGLDPKVAARIKEMDLKIADVADGENGNLVFTFANDLREIPMSTSETTDLSTITTNEECSEKGGYWLASGTPADKCYESPEAVEEAYNAYLQEKFGPYVTGTCFDLSLTEPTFPANTWFCYM